MRISFKCLALIFIIGLSTTAINTKAQNIGKLKCVVIDPGHGGKDPGTHGRKYREKDVVLKVALKLGEYIKKNIPDVKIIYTRKTDVFIPLKTRAEIANKAHADLFISIHANYIGNSNTSGTETFALGTYRADDNLEVAKKENSAILLEDDYTTTYEGFNPKEPESYIIFGMMQNKYLDKSIRMAQLIENEFKVRVGRYSRGVRQAGFLVMRETIMPSVLIELGFLSNAKEENYLGSDKGQSLLASGIFRAFRTYKEEYDARSDYKINHKKVVSSKKTTEGVKKVSKGIVYRIQIASSIQKIKKGTSVYRKYHNIFEYYDGSRYKYTIGKSSSWTEINKQLKEVRKKVKGCFVVNFK